MTVKIAFFNASGLLPIEIEREIRAGIDDGIALMRQHVPVENVGIVALLDDYVSQETGIGGRSYGPDACAIFIDETNPNLPVNPRRNAANVVVHELHHVLRARTFSFKWRDLCGAAVIVLEGLAVHCEKSVGFTDDWYMRGISESQLIPLFERILPIASDPKAEWDWIYDLNDLPAHVYKAVYPMGYHVVRRYFVRTGRNPFDSIATPWEEIWHAAMVGAHEAFMDEGDAPFQTFDEWNGEADQKAYSGL